MAISIEKHKSGVIVIVGHHDCAGNPVNEKMHRMQIKKAIQNINNWNSGVPVVGVWLNRDWKSTFIS